MPFAHATFAPEARSVTRARHWVQRQLEMLSCAEPTVGTAALLVSELATNAVTHAGTTFSVCVQRGVATVTVEVADNDARHPAMHDGGDYRGHGLDILQKMAEDWGIRREHGGKTVYFRIPC